MNYIAPVKYSATQEIILDTAEHLFATQGIHATTLRAITSTAKVNLAAVNYHFGSKKQLIQAVLLRRMTPLNNERHRQLNAIIQTARDENRRTTVAEILHAFIEPTLHFSQKNMAHKDFMSIVSTLMMNPHNEFRSLFVSIMKPLIDQLFAALKAALPTIPSTTLQMRLQFTLGTLTFAMREIDIPISAQQQQPASDIETLIDETVSFVSAGMEPL
ncbi:MAG: TetR family transcriptional regulator [Desulfuromonas sp.]|nr:TetR family transcriptional regulator [Desulfuromonas sp.]